MRLDLPQPYRDLEHTADVGVAVEGGDAPEALALLVLAQSQLLAGGEAVVVDREARIAVRARGEVALAVSALRELLFRFATERVLAGWCEVVRLSADEAEVLVGLGPYDAARHAEGLDLKAVTWHQARFERGGDGRWRAQVVFDI